MEAVAEVKKAKTEEGQNKVICFVCTGNTCRSPMAAALVNHKSETYRAISAGLAPCEGEPIASHAAAALSLEGILPTETNPYDRHRACSMTDEIAESADLIVGMTGTHLMQLFARFPTSAHKIRPMPMPIADPFMGNLADYRACLAAIEAGIAEAGWL